MEKEGLCKGMEFLSANALNISTLVTDRHNQISKFISKEHPSIEHRYDIWHVSKGMNTDSAFQSYIIYVPLYIIAGVKKKLVKLGNYKDCNIINEWTKSITNHMYLCAASAPDGNGEEIATRWKSLMDHICDSHEGCYHLPLGEMERRKKWFIPGKESMPI